MHLKMKKVFLKILMINKRVSYFFYNRETDRKWKTLKREHHDKVRLTKQYVEAGNVEQANANKRINAGDGGLARYAVECTKEIDWENSRIVGEDRRWTQRKYLEGVESLRQKNKGVIPLNCYKFILVGIMIRKNDYAV